MNILEHATDTAGFSEVIFALFDLLGLQFSPRIRDLADQQLFRLGKVPTDLKSLFSAKIDQALIIKHWDDLLHIAASLKFGWTSASLFISKLQNLPPHHSLLRALQEYGRLVKTIFILDYLNHPDFRRSIHAQLNKGESIHSLRRFLLFARQARLRHDSIEELTHQSACLTLLTNAVITWNTVYLQKSIDYLQAQGEAIDPQTTTHLSPARFYHINPHGKFLFDTQTQSQQAIGFRLLNIPLHKNTF